MLMRIMGESRSLEEARARLDREVLYDEQRLEAWGRLTAESFARVKAVLQAVDHDDETATPETVGAAFDRAAAVSPEGGVALYSLGDPVLLQAITGEVSAWITGLGLLGGERRLLEVGCGIGRFLSALAPEAALAIGLDVSAAMVGEAARRCAALGNVTVLRSSGRDLACVADGSVDLLLFADSFPYLVQVGRGVAQRHAFEAARVLRPGGRVLILNYSYRGDPALDDVEAETLFRAAGLNRIATERPRFQGWDATPFLFGRVASS